MQMSVHYRAEKLWPRQSMLGDKQHRGSMCVLFPKLERLCNYKGKSVYKFVLGTEIWYSPVQG